MITDFGHGTALLSKSRALNVYMFFKKSGEQIPQLGKG